MSKFPLIPIHSYIPRQSPWSNIFLCNILKISQIPRHTRRCICSLKDGNAALSVNLLYNTPETLNCGFVTIWIFIFGFYFKNCIQVLVRGLTQPESVHSFSLHSHLVWPGVKLASSDSSDQWLSRFQPVIHNSFFCVIQKTSITTQEFWCFVKNQCLS